MLAASNSLGAESLAGESPSEFGDRSGFRSHDFAKMPIFKVGQAASLRRQEQFPEPGATGYLLRPLNERMHGRGARRSAS